MYTSVSVALLALVLLQATLSVVSSAKSSVLQFQSKEVRLGKASYLNEQQTDRDQRHGDGGNIQCTPAVPCDHDKCKLPNCSCSGTDIPGGLAVEKVPQMVTLTFHAAITISSYQYSSVFHGRTNPNKCPVSGTFFVSHEYSNYTLVHDLYAARQELGVNGITYSFDWQNASEKDWENHMGGERLIISKFANVSIDLIRGMRTPYLQMGGNDQMTAIKNVGLQYDSTRASTFYVESPHLLWPYTYDYASIQDCPSSNCPNYSFPGVWEVPLLAFRCPDGTRSATADGCRNITTQSQAYQLLIDKFDTHYKSTNRAPMVISLGGAWMTNNYTVAATSQFLDYVGKLKDVYVISAGQVIDWIKSPTPIASLPNFKPWKCDDVLNQCTDVQTCLYDDHRRLLPPGSEAKYRMPACVKACPSCYPWLGDPSGTSC